MEFPTPTTFLRSNITGSRPDRFYSIANLYPILSNINLTTDLCSDHLSIEFSIDLNQRSHISDSSKTNTIKLISCTIIEQKNGQMLAKT